MRIWKRTGNKLTIGTRNNGNKQATQTYNFCKKKKLISGNSIKGFWGLLRIWFLPFFQFVSDFFCFCCCWCVFLISLLFLWRRRLFLYFRVKESTFEGDPKLFAGGKKSSRVYMSGSKTRLVHSKINKFHGLASL